MRHESYSTTLPVLFLFLPQFTERIPEIVDVIVGKRGPESDVNLLIKQQKNFDKEQKFQGDKGYQGAERTITPKKKPRKQEMSPEMK